MPKLTIKEIAEALDAAGGQVFIAADKLGCPAERIKRRIARSPRLTAVVEAFSGKLVDAAVLSLHRAVLDGDSWAVRLTLTSLGKERGYGKPGDSDKAGEANFLKKSGGVSVQQVLHTLIENDDYTDYCRSKHQAASQAPAQLEPNASEPLAPEVPASCVSEVD